MLLHVWKRISFYHWISFTVFINGARKNIATRRQTYGKTFVWYVAFHQLPNVFFHSKVSKVWLSSWVFEQQWESGENFWAYCSAFYSILLEWFTTTLNLKYLSSRELQSSKEKYLPWPNLCPIFYTIKTHKRKKAEESADKSQQSSGGYRRFVEK